MFFDRKKGLKKIDYVLIVTTLLLLAFGLVMVKSATNSYLPAKRTGLMRMQSFSTLLGLFAMFILMFTPPKLFKKLYIPIYIISNLLLVYTLVNGAVLNNSRSWIKISESFQFQPSEFVKVGIIISLGKILENNKDKINRPLVFLKLIVLALIPVVLILMQPDKGTAMVLFGIIAAMFFIGGINWKYIAAGIGAIAVALPIFWMKLDTYAKNRIFNFLEPERDIKGTGLQGYIGKITVGSGRFSGLGLFKGLQNNNNYVPVKHSDFIFPIIAEELGFRGGMLLFILYAVLLLRMVSIARSSDYYSRVTIIGIVTMFVIHIWENIGMTMNLMPITGIPLPLISHGGTFQIANLISIGIVLGIKYHRETYVKVPGAKIDNLFRR